MGCEPQETVIEWEVRYYRCSPLINNQLLRRARRTHEYILEETQAGKEPDTSTTLSGGALSYTQRAGKETKRKAHHRARFQGLLLLLLCSPPQVSPEGRSTRLSANSSNSILSIRRSPELYTMHYARIRVISKLFPVALSWCRIKTHPPALGFPKSSPRARRVLF